MTAITIIINCKYKSKRKERTKLEEDNTNEAGEDTERNEAVVKEESSRIK